MSQSPPSNPVATPISREEKERLLRENREALDRDLWVQSLTFKSMPRSVDLQLSNFCNMSCTMCYDGDNPPLQKLDEDVAARISEEVLPTASVITPFAGSEPLILTWETTLEFAQRYRVELDLITNAQFLDEEKFRELEPHVTKLTFSIDSHMRDVYERIRLRSRPDKVFENIPRAASLCREHDIGAEANVVFMVENAPFMHETVAFLADLGCTTVRLLAFHMMPILSSERRFSDAQLHMSAEWFEWMMGRIRRVAKEKKIHLIFEGKRREEHDFRPSTHTSRTPGGNAVWAELGFYHPGYCVQSVDRIKIETGSDVYPCCVGSDGNLRLGNLERQSFQEVWNGPEAQDLRRAMLTLDLPEFCKNCEFHLAWIPPEQEHMPFVDWYHKVHSGGTVPLVSEDRRTIEMQSPDHLVRDEAPPVFRWTAPDDPPDQYQLVLGLAGRWGEGNEVFEIDGDATEFEIPADRWQELRTNIAYWWALFGLRRDSLDQSLRSASVRCLVRHQPIPRVEGSTLYNSGPQAADQ